MPGDHLVGADTKQLRHGLKILAVVDDGHGHRPMLLSLIGGIRQCHDRFGKRSCTDPARIEPHEHGLRGWNEFGNRSEHLGRYA